ncbi:uncharacterized protein [Acropora muricata]|uniref:uncharacterized protein isoform X8 n=1 Tax=Acropora muricata TaxID=159855 RepID=UPI0034E55A67
MDSIKKKTKFQAWSGQQREEPANTVEMLEKEMGGVTSEMIKKATEELIKNVEMLKKGRGGITVDKVKKEREELKKLMKEGEEQLIKDMEMLEKDREELKKLEKEREKVELLEKAREQLQVVEKAKEKLEMLEKASEKLKVLENAKEDLEKLKKEREQLEKLKKEKEEQILKDLEMLEKGTEDRANAMEVLEKWRAAPPEIHLRGPRALEAYYKALEEGKTRVKRIPLMLIGQDRSGKTSLKKSLKGIPFNPHEDSTVGIDVDPSYFKVTTETWKIGEEDQATNEETKRYFEYNLGRQVIKNLKHDIEAQNLSERDEVTENSPPGILGPDASSMHSLARTLSRTERNVNHASETTDNCKLYPEQPAGRDETLSPPEALKEIECLLPDLLAVNGMEGEDDVYSVLWDFAGESVYYETHTLFLTSRAIFLLAYDLSRNPHEKALSERKQGRYGVIYDRIGTKTNLDYLDYWMTSVSSVSRKIKDPELHSVLPETLPCVFLVCTNADRPSGGEDPNVLALKVYGELRKKPYSTHLCGKFEVDNTKSSNKPECPGVSRLRGKIREVAKELPQMKEFIPIKWLKFEKKLQQFLNNGHQYITLENAKKIAYNDCQIHDDGEFKTALDFLHDQKILLHFDNTDELNRFVFLDLQWLIDIMKKVITIKPYDDEDTEFEDLWLKLQEEGILEEKLLKHVWGPLIREHAVFKTLIEIMEKFSLLCSWPASNDFERYLVPSMLISHPPQNITQLIASAQLPSLFIKFNPGQVPPRLFPRLVTQFLLLGKDNFWSSLNPQLYQNFARLYVAEDDKCSVVLLCHSSLIEVVVHGDSDSFEVSCCAQSVFGQLLLILERMRKEFFWLKGMSYQAGVLCTVCCQERKVKFCHKHGTNDCEREDCLHFISESEMRSASESITCTKFPTALNNKVYIENFAAWFGSCQKRTPCEVEERLTAVSSSKVTGGKEEICLPSPEEKPPQLSFKLKEECDLPKSSKTWSDDHVPIDILLLAVDNCDFLSCFSFLDQPFKSYKFGNGYVYFGRMGEASEQEKLKVALMNCSKGAATPGGSLTVLLNAFRVLRPKAVFSVGTCISLSLENARKGDVVISSKLTTAEGYSTPVGRLFASLVRDAPYAWVAPLVNPDELNVKVHCNCDILSHSLPEMYGYDDICAKYPGAVAVETEGAGLYAAAYDANIEWVIVKGVASHFHERKSVTREWMSFASTMAASVVAKMLSDPTVFLEWPHLIQGGDSKALYPNFTKLKCSFI